MIPNRTTRKAAVVKPDLRPVRKSLKLTQPELKTFADFFYRHTGISFSESKYGLLQTQISGVLGKQGFETFEEAMAQLQSPRGAPQLQEVVNALTINETYFYREKYQFEALAQTLLPGLTGSRQRGSKIRIWCLPCSTGEEPYSISIFLRENWPGWHIFDTEIFGSDIDTNVLKTAVRAQYNQRAVSRMPKELHTRYFQTDKGVFALKRDVADTVKFNQINLLDRKMTSTMHNMDVIFCRNVLIYLDDDARKTAIKNLYDSLRSGGYLLLGHSETMSWMSSMFTIERLGGSAAYKKG